MAGTKERAHLIASASAKRGRVVFTFIELAKTNSPLRSLATAAIEEKRGPTAASALILKDIPGGGIHVWIEEGTSWQVVEPLGILCLEKRHEIFVDTPSTFREPPPNRTWFLSFHTMSQRMAPYNKNSSFWPEHWLTKKGGDKRKLTKSDVDPRANKSILTPQWLRNHKDFANGHTVNRWSEVSKDELHIGQLPSIFPLNILIISLVGKTFAAILHRCNLKRSWILDLQIWPLMMSKFEGGEPSLHSQ